MMFLDEMDLSLWDPPENQVYTDESSYARWEYNLYFDPRLDVIEADALNKKSCLQVMKIQENKADSEIREVEADELMLQRQVAREDNMGLAASNKEIVNLESTLMPLQNENQLLAGTTLEERHAAEQATKEHSSKSTENEVLSVQNYDPSGMKGKEVVLAGTTLEEIHAAEQATKEHSSKSTENEVLAVQNYDPSGMKGKEVLLAGTTLEEIHAAEQATKEHSSKSTENEVLAVQNYDPSGMKGKEVVLAGTTLEEIHAAEQATKEHSSKSTENDVMLVQNYDPSGTKGKEVVLAGTTLEEIHAAEQATKEYSNKSTENEVTVVQYYDPSGMKGKEVLLAGTTLEEIHAAVQATKEHSSKSTENEVTPVQNYDPSGMKGKEVVHAGIVRTIGGTQPGLLNPMIGERSDPQRKLMGGGEYNGDNAIRGTQQQLAGAKRSGDFAGISSTSQLHFRRRSETSLFAPLFQENNNLRNAQNMLVRSYDRTSQVPWNVHNVEVVFPMASLTPSSRMACIDNMSLVQLKALASQLNIVGVSKTRKADLQQLLRTKLQAQDWP
ncbi:uncharacterized protein LOC107031927 [Solanum pennellii]|uniref:Uncharacterized protein LOC107031927 n=1 Tax=Solanum pennellii TaxID=28526 RepID=A0ABM1UX40_SOLPN|nr:uncharacterized protein LOC107031927 [Solanum pennellii]